MAGVLLFFFAVGCGVNYHRDTFAQASGLPVQPSTEEELISLCESLLEEANSGRQLVEEDRKRRDEAELSGYQELADTVRQAYDGLESQYPTLTAGYGAPKGCWRPGDVLFGYYRRVHPLYL